MRPAIFVAIVMFFGGCVSTTYTKSVTVRKDENGRIVETIITESIIQPNQSGYRVKLEHIKGVQP